MRLLHGAARDGTRALGSLALPRSRTLRSHIWQPTGGISPTATEAGHEKLVRAGYIRQAHLGSFHLLPLGLRVQEKIERLLDASMSSIGASKVSLSSITSQELWETSGRFEHLNSELFKFHDRRDVSYMLSPTHEEEITYLVSRTIRSYKDVPLRLYQICKFMNPLPAGLRAPLPASFSAECRDDCSGANVPYRPPARKYRDELRPRHGLLRSREFTMKDLYTFDLNLEAATQTYQLVQHAYSSFFSQLKVPILTADASCGDMGGTLSHEYHLPSELGEDVVVHCKQCGYTANEEVAETSSALPPITASGPASVEVWRGISKDRRTLVNAWYPSNDEAPAAINIHAVRNLVSDLDTSVEDAVPFWAEAVRERLQSASSPKLQLVNLVDSRLGKAGLVETDTANSRVVPLKGDHTRIMQETTVTTAPEGEALNLVRIQDGDPCTRCGTGTLEVQKTLELGHTFHLGTRYSDPLGATVSMPCEPPNEHTTRTLPLEMGCFGIGISRVMGALANRFADSAGLRWPVNIAPYEVVIICETSLLGEAEDVYDIVATMAQPGSPSFTAPVDVILDDRRESIAWKLKDADLTGYPVVIVLGRAWREGRGCEVQCRWLGLKDFVKVEDLASYLVSIYKKLE